VHPHTTGRQGPTDKNSWQWWKCDTPKWYCERRAPSLFFSLLFFALHDDGRLSSNSPVSFSLLWSKAQGFFLFFFLSSVGTVHCNFFFSHDDVFSPTALVLLCLMDRFHLCPSPQMTHPPHSCRNKWCVYVKKKGKGKKRHVIPRDYRRGFGSVIKMIIKRTLVSLVF